MINKIITKNGWIIKTSRNRYIYGALEEQTPIGSYQKEPVFYKTRASAELALKHFKENAKIDRKTFGQFFNAYKNDGNNAAADRMKIRVEVADEMLKCKTKICYAIHTKVTKTSIRCFDDEPKAA